MQAGMLARGAGLRKHCRIRSAAWSDPLCAEYHAHVHVRRMAIRRERKRRRGKWPVQTHRHWTSTVRLTYRSDVGGTRDQSVVTHRAIRTFFSKHIGEALFRLRRRQTLLVRRWRLVLDRSDNGWWQAWPRDGGNLARPGPETGLYLLRERGGRLAKVRIMNFRI